MPEGDSRAWRRDAAGMIEDALNRLGLLDSDDFEVVLAEVLQEFGEFIGAVAVGECTGTIGKGVYWLDPEETTLEELLTCLDVFYELDQVDAITTLQAPTGRPASIVPNSPGSYSRYLAVLSNSEHGLSADAASLCTLMSSAVAAVRKRVEAARALNHRLEVQEFLNSISSLAAVSDDGSETLGEIFDLARAFFDIGAVSYWAAEGSTFTLEASASADGRSQINHNMTVEVDLDASRELLEHGYMRVPVSFFAPDREFLLPSHSEALVVPISGPHGSEGAVVFTDPDQREWDDVDLHAAKSITRSVQKVVARARLERAAHRRVEFDAAIRRIATTAAKLLHDEETVFLSEVTSSMIDLLGLEGASVWRHLDTSYERIYGEYVDKTPELARAKVGTTPAATNSLHERGHAFVDITRLPTTGTLWPTSGKALVIPIGIGTEDSGIISFYDPERGRWSEDEILDAKVLASVVTHTLSRFAAEREVERRYELEALSGEISALAVDATLANIETVLTKILRRIAEFFDLSEVQTWLFSDGQAYLRGAYRPDGYSDNAWEDVRFDSSVMADKAWHVVRLHELAGDRELRDPPDTNVLLMSDRPGAESIGTLNLVDPKNRQWSDDELSYFRVFASTLAQFRGRMTVSRALEYQRRAQELLSDATAAFVDLSLEDAHEVVLASLERVRAFLDCESLALFAFDQETMTITCSGEAVRDGQQIQTPFAPIARDDALVAQVLDPTAGPDWSVGELFRIDRTDINVHIQPVVNGRDVMALSAVSAGADPLNDESARVMVSLAATLAQLRSRLGLEQSARRRADSDRVLGEIAADFVDRSVEDANEGIFDALAKVGALFGCRSVGLWKLDSGLAAAREIGWVADGVDDSGPLHRRVPADHPTLEVIYDVETSMVFESPGLHWQHLDTSTTVVAAPIRVRGEIIAFVSSEVSRELHFVLDPEVQEEVLGSLALLVRQLWNRLDSDRAIGRQLAMEDLLRRFATRLTSTPAEDLGGDERALEWLSRQLGLEHVSAWSVVVSEGSTAIDLLAESNPAGWSIPAARKHLVLDIAADPGVFASESDSGSWAIEDAPPRIRSIVSSIKPGGNRRVGYVRQDQAESGSSNYLIVSRAGRDPIAEHEFSILNSALTILGQHQARVSAERTLAAAFTAAPIAISLRESDSTFIACNSAYEQLTGRTAEEMAGSRIDLVVSPNQIEAVFAELDRALPFGKFERESAFRRPDGTILWADVRSTPVQIPGRRDPVLLTYAEDITERRRNRQLLEYQATHDELTGLPNRRAFVAQVTAELARSSECAVLVLDLDRFKVVNDSLGHSVGDQLLITCSDRIRLSLRPGDAVCRLGGDEFAILLRAPADPQAASVVAERLLRLLREPVRVGGEEVFPSASVGIAIPEEGDAVEDLLRYADAAMYQAKGHGRDQSVRFDRSMREAVVERIRTETDLRRAIYNGQLEVHYQPEFLLDTGGIVGAEALVRWRHPERGLLAAGTFISLAEETGLVVDLGRWVLGQATTQAATWVAEGHDIIMRVNLSARQLRAAVVGEVKEALAAANLPASRLCLELTETTIMDDVEESARILQQFSDMGVQIAIDDFGTGFSSLAYLKRFPVDILKIDQAFVEGVGVDPDDTAIVHSIIGLAQTLRLEVVAEGIEDETQIAELVRLGCRRGQGFHLARPAPADDIGLLLLADKRAE